MRDATTGLTILAVVLDGRRPLFGYHRELGKSLVSLGEKLTGESPLAEAAPAPTQTDTNTIPVDATQQPRSTPADPTASVKPAPVAALAPPPAAAGSSAEAQPAQQPQTPPAPRPASKFTRTPAASSAGFENLSTSSPQSGDTGQLELETALQFLNPSVGLPKTAEGAKWLWMAVEKGNPKAEVMLADLFVRGDGVTKSCSASPRAPGRRQETRRHRGHGKAPHPERGRLPLEFRSSLRTPRNSPESRSLFLQRSTREELFRSIHRLVPGMSTRVAFPAGMLNRRWAI